MNYRKIPVDQNVEVRDLVSYDTESGTWKRATNLNTLLGVVCGLPEEQNGELLAFARFSGELEARASQEIPVEGGSLAVEDGGVYVSTSEDQNGRFILPDLNTTPAGGFCVIKL